MFRFAVRAERARSAALTAGRLMFVVVLVAVLLALSVAPALAASGTNPFRWW